MNIILSIFYIALSALLTKIFCLAAQNSRLIDKPNERSLHSVPTVRGGGFVFITLSLLSLPILCYYTQSSMRNEGLFILCIVLLGTVSFFDDLYTLTSKFRFVIHLLIALVIAFFITINKLDLGLFVVSNQFLIIPFILFSVIWAINHFNFMDGLDGFCASQALFLFVSYSVLFNTSHALLYQEFCFALVCSLIGFLVFNFPPAKLFMGDIGSASLGLISFYIALIAQQKYQIPIFYWFLLNGLFLFDATITLIRRVINKEKWYSPHRKHAYQRLRQFGVSARKILAGQLVINVIFLILVLLLQHNKFNLNSVLVVFLGLMVFIYTFIERCFPMFKKTLSATD